MPTQKRCLVAWELGAGYGHLATLRPIIEGLSDQGYAVWFAARDVCRASETLGDLPIEFLQAPYKTSYASPTAIFTFPQILARVGWDDERHLHALVSSWTHLFDLARPELLVFNHSPAAMLAARGREVKRVVAGTGFEIPPFDSPMQVLRTWEKHDARELHAEEASILERANKVLQSRDGTPLASISQLYAACDECLLLTLPELDPYQREDDPSYFGNCSMVKGVLPQWPSQVGRKIFMYLKPFRGMNELLSAIVKSGQPCLCCIDGDVTPFKARFSAKNLHITSELYDMQTVAEECDMAIHSAGHGTTFTLLLAGKPSLLVPNHLEQLLTARRVEAWGAGLAVEPGTRDFEPLLQRLLHEDEIKQAARRFAEKYAGLDAVEMRRQAVHRVLAVCA